jgi:hypothetical protein
MRTLKRKRGIGRKRIPSLLIVVPTSVARAASIIKAGLDNPTPLNKSLRNCDVGIAAVSNPALSPSWHVLVWRRETFRRAQSSFSSTTTQGSTVANISF